MNQELPRFDAVFLLPSYPFPKQPVSPLNFEGLADRVLGLPYKTHHSGILYDTRLKGIAAAMMVRSGETNTIVTMSRAVRSWMHESYADLMADYITPLLGTAAARAKIIREQDSFDLLSELQEAARISKEEDFKTIVLLTDHEHAKRTRLLIKSQQLELPTHQVKEWEQVLSGEKYLGTLPTATRKIIAKKPEQLHNSWYWVFWKAREAFARFLPAGALSELSRRTR